MTKTKNSPARWVKTHIIFYRRRFKGQNLSGRITSVSMSSTNQLIKMQVTCNYPFCTVQEAKNARIHTITDSVFISDFVNKEFAIKCVQTLLNELFYE
jgi:hypothetical protein